MNYTRKRERLGDILINRGIISQKQLALALDEQKKRGLFLGETLVELGYVTQKKLNQVLCEHLNIDFVDIRITEPNDEVFNLLEESIMRKYTLIPFDYSDNNAGSIKVAMADPMNILAQDDINIVTGMQVEPYLANGRDIKSYLDKRFGKRQAQNIVEMYKREQGYTEESNDEDRARKEEIQNAPIVQLVNSIIEQAVRQRASDIHIEPFDNMIRVRYRIDGSLVEAITYDKALMQAITARVKIMSDMDISEKRKPQDGRTTVKVDNREYDIRVSNLPTIYGEKIVMRLAAKETFKRDTKELGLSDRDLVKFRNILKNPNGIILVTGPTGSGKSTTLYTALCDLNRDDVNIITVEDPVEANIDGINQVQVNVKANLTFASVLRSILRQDPDIIMIGEIRDSETAQIAVRASITGHLVVSTLHTNSTGSSISRLVDMGVEPYLLADSLAGIVAQRLIKRLCSCKKEVEATDDEKRKLGAPPERELKIYKPCGCKLCNQTGYYGRIGIYEIMQITPAIKKLISKNADASEINEQAIREGMSTLKKSAASYVMEGITSIDEMMRISYEIEE